MGKQSIPWAVGLTGLLYFGMLGYWQYDAFETALFGSGNASQNAIDGAIFGFGFGVAYVAFMIGVLPKNYQKDSKKFQSLDAMVRCLHGLLSLPSQCGTADQIRCMMVHIKTS